MDCEFIFAVLLNLVEQDGIRIEPVVICEGNLFAFRIVEGQRGLLDAVRKLIRVPPELRVPAVDVLAGDRIGLEIDVKRAVTAVRVGRVTPPAVIARARYLGKVKRKPLCLQLDVALEVAPGGQVRLLDGEQWLEGTVVDGAVTRAGPGGCETVVFIVAPFADGSPGTMEYEGRSYRCATM